MTPDSAQNHAASGGVCVTGRGDSEGTNWRSGGLPLTGHVALGTGRGENKFTTRQIDHNMEVKPASARRSCPRFSSFVDEVHQA